MIQPENLTEVNPEELLVEKKKKKAGSSHRDLLRVWACQMDGEAVYMLLGLEEQSYVDYTMPVRSMLYDAESVAREAKG